MKQAGFIRKNIVIGVCALLLLGFGGYQLLHVVRRDIARAQLATRARATAASGRELVMQLQTAWQQTLVNNPPDGDVAIAVYDKTTGATARHANTTSTFNTASVVKLSILETALLQNQQQGKSGLTANQLTQAAPMIEQSNNDAATNLWNSIGGDTALNKFFHEIGATHTTAGTDWGLTQTTASDQLLVINQIAYPTRLSAQSVATADNLMNHVESDQRWGVTGGVPANVSVQLKNGWLDYNQGWNVNSVGHVHGDGVDYTIAVLTDNNDSEQDGIATIEALSADTWRVVDESS